MTKLEAVNKMLKAIRVRKVQTLDIKHPDVDDALLELDLQLVSLLKNGDGWWFNRVYNVEMQPDPDTKHIQAPTHVLSVQLWDIRDKRDFPAIALVGHLVFDSSRNTYEFDQPLYLTQIVERTWEQLPVAAQFFVLYKAMAEFISDKIADTAKVVEKENLARVHWADLRRDEIASQQLNTLSSPRATKARVGRRPFLNTTGRLF